MQEVITYKDLAISLCEIVCMEQLEIHEAVNQHAVLRFTAVVKDKMKEEVIHKIGDQITLLARINGEEKTPFIGKITDIRMVTDGNVYKLQVEAYDLTYEMDLVRKKKSFQDIQGMLSAIIQVTVKGYAGSDVMVTFPDKKIGELIVQFQETDWEFLKRMASIAQFGLYPQTDKSGIRVFAGVPNLEAKAEWEDKMPASYHVTTDLEAYQRFTKNGGGKAAVSDYITYHVESGDYLALGAKVSCQKQEFQVLEVKRTLREGLLVSSYQLRKKNGHRCLRYDNPRIMGASIGGSVLEVKRDKIKAQLDIDGPQEVSGAYWFSHSTVSASSGGSGWYSMPKKGDEVRAYFPVKREGEAYAITKIGVHIPEGAGKESPAVAGGGAGGGTNQAGAGAPPPEDAMGDPNNKNITIPNGDSIRLTPEGVQIATAGGKASLVFSMDGTVTVNGTNNVVVGAVEEISLRAEDEITVNAVQSIDLLCEKSGHLELLPGGTINLEAKEIIEN